MLLSKQFVIWIAAANIISWPLAIFFTNRWLDNFAYRTSFPLWVLPLTGVLTLGIALITVGLISAKASSANPIDSLRYE